MKLSLRTLLLIIPVVIISTAVSSYIIYANQKKSIIKLEKSAIQLNMEKLASHYSQASNFLNSYSYSLARSSLLTNYFADTSNLYRELHLNDNLQNTLADLARNESRFAALALLDHNTDNIFYVESSLNPFSNINPDIIQLVKKGLQASLTHHIQYLYSSAGEGVLVRYDVYDKRNFSPPLNGINKNSFIVVVMVGTEQYDQLRLSLERDHHTIITYSTTPPEHTQPLTHTVKLDHNYYATIDPARFILNDQLDAMMLKLITSFGLSALLSVLILLMLFYRYVIHPITKLDKQLRDVEANKRANIEVLTSKDEIGHLSVKFYEMYQALTDSLTQTKQLADSDQLTKLANRRHFHALVVEKLNQLNPKEKSIWVLYIDLDNFKFVNDKYGHKVGDAVLVQFSQLITDLALEFQKKYRAEALSARLSGDEFAIFISAQHPQLIYEFCERILLPMQEGFQMAIGTYPITASIGIATSPKDGQNIELLLSNADTAMYQAKSAGKNQYAFYSKQLDKAIKRTANIERALRANNFDKEFSLVYMPYMDKSGRELIGIEALLRWNSDTLGFVSPDEFIPIAEKTGLFEQVDRWVISQAFASFHQLQRQFDHPIQLAINLSSAELDFCHMADFIEQQAKHYAVPHHLIDFEITETFASDSKGFPLLYELSKLGFQLAIDDFGSGYTSFAQLVKYPIQKIKFDRSFLCSMLDAGKGHIIKPLIELCHSEQLSVTAEGVETQEMHQWLLESGCDYMQGYHFGQPMAIEALRQWHTNRTTLEERP